MNRMRSFAAVFLAVFALARLALAQTEPSDAPSSDAATTQPVLHPTDLLGPPYISHVHAIQFRPPLNCTEIDRATPDSIVEFDRDDFNWQLKCWSVRLEKPLELTVHKDQFGQPKDGVLEITLANIKQQTPEAEVLRNEVISVGRVRVGMIAVRYETAAHDRRFTQQAIFEAPDADHRLYYFLDLTGPGKPQLEPEDIVNPAEKMAHDTFAEVVDSVTLLDRADIVDQQKHALYATMNLFVMWTADHSRMVRDVLVPEQFQRIIRDGQDVGYQHIIEEYDPDAKSSEDSTLRIGVRSRMAPTPEQQWDTETWMFSTADRKHEHWKTAARCTNNRGELIDSFSQVGASDEETKPYAIEAPQGANGAILPPPQGLENNIDLETHRTLQVTTTHKEAQLNPFNMISPPWYVPQAYSYILPRILPLKPKKYMFATFVPGDVNNAATGNVMSRYMEVLPLEHVKFHGGEFDAIPITDKITLDGAVTTYYISLDGKFLGSTSTFTAGNNSSTIEVVPTDSDTLERLWPHPDLSPPVDSGTAPPVSEPPAPQPPQ